MLQADQFPKTYERAIRLYETPMSIYLVSLEVQREPSTVARWLRQAGVIRKQGAKPERVPELTRDQADARDAREALKFVPARPLPIGGWYAAGFFSTGAKCERR